MSLMEELTVKRINGNVILFMSPLLGLISGSLSDRPNMKAIKKDGAKRMSRLLLQPIA